MGKVYKLLLGASEYGMPLRLRVIVIFRPSLFNRRRSDQRIPRNASSFRRSTRIVSRAAAALGTEYPVNVPVTERWLISESRSVSALPVSPARALHSARIR